MLHLKTVEPSTFAILEQFMSIPELSSFHLVGGTALSLLYGHRISVDIDLFSVEKFDNQEIRDVLLSNFDSVQFETKPEAFGIFCFIGNAKVDIIRYKHAMIEPLIETEGIRLFSKQDIVAMKIQAVLRRAVKKDFWDIAELLNEYSVEEFSDFHSRKFSEQELYITVPQAITYFTEAEDDADPISLKGQTWDSVKDKIRKAVNIYLK